MSVIQQIQEKYAKLMAVIIAVALLIFVVMLAFENGGSLFNNRSTSVGSVNGKSIAYDNFVVDVEKMEKRYGNSGVQIRQQAVDAAWNQKVDEILQNKELDRLGITVGKKEMGDILYGPNAPDDLKRLFTDTATGEYDGQLAKANIDQMLRMKNGNAKQMSDRQQFIDYINSLETNRLREKYSSLLTNTVNYPKWFIEKQNADNSLMATISYVQQDYSSIADSTIKITDKEIEDYVSKHKKDFKQEESRSIAYVAFNVVPSSDDSTAARERLLALKPEFDTVSNVSRFLAAQGMEEENEVYKTAKNIHTPFNDSILSLPVNAVYGPFIDGANYTLAKLLGVRQQADSVTVRHILIQTAKMDQQTRQFTPTRDTTSAKKLIDSLQTAIRNGANFDSICMKFSEDPGKMDPSTGKFNGGVYKNVYSGQMVGPFDDFIFGHGVGARGVVKTEYGYHYIEILSQKGGTSPAYKIAFLSKPIETSQETYNNASNEAALFAGDSRNQKTFDANVEKLKDRGITKNYANNITPMAAQVAGLTPDRNFIKSIYDADLGEVLEPEKVGEAYVVAIVTEINKEGTMSASKARPSVEPLLKKHKAAEIIKQKLGTPTTLEAAANAWGGKPIQTADSLRMTNNNVAGRPVSRIATEPKVLGAAFNPENKGKVVPEVIEGTEGLYVVRVDNVTTTPIADASIADQRKARYLQGKQQASYSSPIQALKEEATIKDRRAKWF